MNPADIPEALPPHPDEARLRKAEAELARTITGLSAKVARALKSDHPRHRVDAAVGLAQLAQTADAGRNAMVRAIQDQMDRAGGNDGG